ncbi:RNA exonuclease 1 homolog isoform X1 [Lates japonicus]|uniref:RNA exonuclease 1 homolog isoform X1 n=1 Tax=Lates japonicus TaxID=270547 RepID=A0AAD3QXM7_LATJO|nr:RNA exonuclease 1 homolog isoform X1 [Lates japonicus]
MLRSTGFFRGIDCPFYTEYNEGKGSRNGCNRPYCHFRHSQQRRPSYGAPADVKKQRDLHSVQKAEQGYDPFNPEVVRPQEQQNGKPAASGDLSGALELVNKAIEEVRSEVEREKRKLSRIGDEPYDPSKSSSVSSSGAVKSKTAASHMAYDPGSYQITSGGYNPTPGCSKYTLDSDNQGNNSNSMEYVPTAVKKPPNRTHAHQLPSPPPSPKYSNSAYSSKCKYTVDNSRPSTDMEYDPLSNYSAGIAAKSKRVEGAQGVKTDGSKTHKPPMSDLSDEEYVVAVKKPRQQSIDTQKYTFSDSDGESSGTEYRPTSLSNLQQRKGNTGSADESPDEAEPMEVDDDDDADEVLVRKSADALKRGRLNKRKASELTPSSSDDEGDCGMVGSSTGKDEVNDIGIDLSGFQDDLDFDSDPMEECLRIFNESKDVKREDKGRQIKQPSRDSEEEKGTESTLTTLFPGQKKRVSHFVAKGNTDAPSKTVVRPYKRPTAQEVCYQRMQMAQQQAAQLSASVKAASQNSSPSFSGERKRIAHRPNPQITSSKTNAKPAVSRGISPSQTHQTVKAQTTAGILSKTTSTVMSKRVAHTPSMKSTSMKRPVIPTEFGAKVPTNIRQRYLTTFIDECVKFCPSEEIAFQMALDEEKLVYERSSSKNIYLNVAVNTLKKLRSKSSSCPSPVTKEPGSAANRRAQSHEEVLGGRLAATTSFTVNRMGKQQEEKLTGATLYRKLKTYLMTEEQLQEHGYPRTNPEAAGKAVIYNLPEKKVIADPFTKICCRCGTEYKINVNGNCVRKEECSFHWGRLRRHKVAGGWETNYNCCSAAVGSPGCQVAKQHVQDGRKESLDGYVSTFSKSLPPDGNGGVFALDCEMCYTKQGLELTRVTVIDSEMKVIYDTFVKPKSKVVDYNTRFSGVTEEDLESATITLRDVQAVLLSMFSAESILIGHSLESDLLALKLIHSTVIDTAIVFPHRLGLPYKRALKNLMADHLKRIIQDNVEGHDSSEDATACMELMIWKIKEDAKVKR